MALWSGEFPAEIGITLPKGETPVFPLAFTDQGPGWAEAGVIKDAGDDPDVTHGALIIARVQMRGTGLSFHAGDGVGTITKPGLPIAVGEPAINPVPRQLMTDVVLECAAIYGHAPDIAITISIPGGQKLAEKTWNPRLGIVGGLSVLGTTGVVRPFSCAAWIASILAGLMWRGRVGKPMWPELRGPHLNAWFRRFMACRITPCWIWGISPGDC